jgi:aspartate/methionine/tyrosine aminotransferase
MGMRVMNALVNDVASPPVAEADGWLRPQQDFPEQPLLNLAQGVPSYAPALALREEMARLALDENSARYTAILGIPALRSAMAAHLGEVYQAPIDAASVAITAGCNQAYCSVIQALAGPGDEVILSVPFYFNQNMWLQMQGITPRYLRCDPHTALPDAHACEALVTPRTRAVVLVSPNNPTGAIYPPALLEAFLEMARRHDIALVLDETYKDFLPDAARPHALFQQPDWQQGFISLHSFSKSYAMTGYRVGAIAAAATVLESVEKVLDCVTICASNLSQRAAAFALENLSAWRRQRCAELVNRADALRQAFGDSSLNYRLLSAGGFFAYVRHPFDGASSLAVAQHLASEHNLLCLPGTMFGPGQEPYLRLSFTNVDGSRFGEVIERLLASQRTFT